MANAKLTVHDEIRELQQSKGILDLVDTLGDSWSDIDYNPSQVQSNRVSSQYVLLQFSNGRLQNNVFPNQELEDTHILEGPYPVRRWEGRGHRRVMRNIPPTILNGCTRTSAPVYEENKKIDFITVSEDMEAFWLTGRSQYPRCLFSATTSTHDT